MKKNYFTFIPVVLMFLILAGLLVFMCLPQRSGKTVSVSGCADLRGEFGKGVIPLTGQWNFIYGELLTPDEFADIRSESVNIKVPGSWVDSGYPLNGCGTYALTVLTDDPRPLTVFIPEISSAYILWVNGEKVRTAGTVSPEAGNASPFFENALLTVCAENGIIEIVMQVSNYHFVYGGMNDTLLIGESRAVSSWFLRTRSFYCAALGFILMAAFYHLALYVFRRREKVYFIFFCLCFICFIRFLIETNGINEYFQWIPMNMFGMRFYFLIFFLHSFTITIFTLYIFNSGFLSRYKYIFTVYFAANFLLNLFIPTNIIYFTLILTVSSLPAMIFSIVIALKSPVLKKNGMTRLYFIALIFYIIVGFASKLFFDNVLFMTGLLTNMFMVMSQILVLSRRYTDAFEFVERTNENLEQIVDERTKSLQAANDAMRELVSNISHDLKTPLAVMSVNLETLTYLAQTRNDPQYRRHVRAAYQKNLDLQRLVQNLFEVSRIETGRNIYSPQWSSLHRFLSQMKGKYDDFLENQKISFEITSGDDAEIYIDPQKIWSVFDNIIYNAARHTDSGGMIKVTAESNGNSVVITVSDTGCGIAREHLPHIFERFYKASTARSEDAGDSGLGLYIVKSIMDGLGGSVSAESEPGKGTSLILVFQAKELKQSVRININ